MSEFIFHFSWKKNYPNFFPSFSLNNNKKKEEEKKKIQILCHDCEKRTILVKLPITNAWILTLKTLFTETVNSQSVHQPFFSGCFRRKENPKRMNGI